MVMNIRTTHPILADPFSISLRNSIVFDMLTIHLVRLVRFQNTTNYLFMTTCYNKVTIDSIAKLFWTLPMTGLLVNRLPRVVSQ